MCISAHIGDKYWRDGKVTVKGVLDKALGNDDKTAITVDWTTLAGDLNDSDSRGDEDFVV